MADKQYANSDAVTTLASAISSVTPGSLTFNVASAANFPTIAQYRVRIGSELFLVTGGAGTTTWNTTRAIEGTGPTQHVIGDAVTFELTRQGTLGLVSQNPAYIKGTGAKADSGASGYGAPADHTHAGGWSLLNTTFGDGTAQPIILPPIAAAGGFTGIPQTFRHLCLVGTARSLTGTGGSGLVLQMNFNGDRSLLYSYQNYNAAGTSINRTSGASGAYVQAGLTTASDRAAGYQSMFVIWFPYYANTTFNKAGHWRGIHSLGPGTLNHWLFAGSWFWQSTAPIQSIDFLNSVSWDWTTSTVFKLYGIN